MLQKFSKVLNELKNTNSASNKVKLLSQYINDPDICKLFKYVYNPYYLFGVTSKNLKKNNKLSELEFFDNIFEMLDQLITGKVSGNKAISLVNGYINQNLKYEDLIYDISDRK